MLDATYAFAPMFCEICGKPAEIFFTLDDKPQLQDQHWACSKKCAMEIFSRYFDENYDKIKSMRSQEGEAYVHTNINEAMDFIKGQMEKDGHKVTK